MLKQIIRPYIVGLIMAMALCLIWGGTLWASEAQELPVKGMVTMVDLGAASCIPCKMMAPILDKLENFYKGKAAIIYIDLRYHLDAPQHFGVRPFPTPVGMDKSGQEKFRHVGFMSEEDIVKQLISMGVN